MSRKLTPADSLWLEILERTERLESKSPEEIRIELQKTGFPPRLVEEFLARRQPRRHTKAATS